MTCAEGSGEDFGVGPPTFGGIHSWTRTADETDARSAALAQYQKLLEG